MEKDGNYIVFIAEYPNKDTLKEGMSQRMAAVDNQFKTDKRLYLFVSHRFFIKKQLYILEDGVMQYKCNLFFHFFFIMKLLIRSRFVYFHSIQNVLPVFPCLWFLSKDKKLVLDIHGVVPEEHAFAGHKFKALLYGVVEQFLFKSVSVGISVTDAMSRHYKNKYPTSSVQLITYPILPSNILALNDTEISDSYDKKIHIIYSGNLQPWQNIDLMLNVIEKQLSSNVVYTILTGSPEQMKARLASRNLGHEQNVFVDSVAPEELYLYYKKAHYGFILRDDIAVNRVACPTKLVEYMFYGIKPIVKSRNIGDFLKMDYEYLDLTNFSIATLNIEKSAKNISIIASIKNKSKDINIREYLFNRFSIN